MFGSTNNTSSGGGGLFGSSNTASSTGGGDYLGQINQQQLLLGLDLNHNRDQTYLDLHQIQVVGYLVINNSNNNNRPIPLVVFSVINQLQVEDCLEHKQITHQTLLVVDYLVDKQTIPPITLVVACLWTNK